MALSANTALNEIKVLERVLPAQASVTAYEGSILTIDPDGNVGPLASGERFVGHNIAYKVCSSTAGADELRVKTGEGGVYYLRVALTCTTENEGQNAYASDDATYTLDPMGASTPNVLVGTVWQYVDSSNAIVQFRPEAVNAQPIDTQTLVRFFDDFIGDTVLVDGTTEWLAVDVGDATEAIVANGQNGQFALTIAATSEAEDAVLYMGDTLNFDLQDMLKFRTRAKVTTPGTGVTVVFGMAGAHNLDKDTVAQHAWFRCEAGLACVCESDDGTNDNDDKTGATLTTDVWYDFEIDFQDDTDVKFFINGSQVAAATTFDMSNHTGKLQPYFSADKASGTGTGTLTLDYVEILARRS